MKRMWYGSQYHEMPDSRGGAERVPSVEGTESIAKVCGMRRSNFLLLAYLPVYIGYIAAAAAIFMVTEGTVEEELRQRLRERRMQFLDSNQCVADWDLESLISEVVRAGERGVTATNNATGESNWSLGQSFFFSSTIIATIGYGHVHPLSEGGKLFCIAYALLGIPMTFVLLTAIVERMLEPTVSLLFWFDRRLGHVYKSFNIRVMHLWVMFTICVLWFLIIPAAVFYFIEPGWGYFDAFYYCFISLTTIGLGDYIPGDAPDQQLRPYYKIAVAIYLLLGLSAVSLLLRLFHAIPQLNLGLFLLHQTDQRPSPLPSTETTRLTAEQEASAAAAAATTDVAADAEYSGRARQP